MRVRQCIDKNTATALLSAVSRHIHIVGCRNFVAIYSLTSKNSSIDDQLQTGFLVSIYGGNATQLIVFLLERKIHQWQIFILINIGELRYELIGWVGGLNYGNLEQGQNFSSGTNSFNWRILAQPSWLLNLEIRIHTETQEILNRLSVLI